MISVKAMEFYLKINKNLLTLREDIDFLKSAIPYNIEKSILTGIIASSVSTCGERTNYSILRSGNLRQEYLDNFARFKSEFRPIDFDRRVNILARELKSLFAEYEYVDFQTSSLLKDLEEITIKYQDVIMREQKGASLIAFFEHLKVAIEKYESLLVMTLSFKYCIQPDKNELYNNGTMEKIRICMPGIFDVSEFTTIIYTMDSVYSLLAQAFQEIETKKLQYIKIETGSAFAEFFGEKKIINLMTWLLSKIAQVAYRRMTNDGQLEKNAKYQEAIDGAMNMIERAEEDGIDVDKAKMNVSKAVEAATGELAQIIEKAPGLELNGEQYGERAVPKLLPKGGKRLLRDNNKKGDNSHEK